MLALGDRLGEGVDARLHRLVERQPLPAPHQALLRAHGKRRGIDDRMHAALDRGVDLRRLDDFLDHAPGLGLAGIDVLAGEQHPRGAAPADQARQQRRLDDGGNADLDLGHAEMRRVGGDAQVAGRRHFEAGAQGVAFHAADHRHRTIADRLAELVDHGDEGARRPRSVRIPAMWLMSAPPMKARPPAPEKTTTRSVFLGRQRMEGRGEIVQGRRVRGR